MPDGVLPGPAVAELIGVFGAARDDLRDAVALWCQRLAQQLIVVKVATACDDDLHEDLPGVLGLPNKKAVLFRGIFLRAVCCSDTQGWLGFPWPLPRGWAKTCATLPWPLSGWSLQFVVFLLTPRSPREGSGCQGGDPAALGSAQRGP